jgi:hypothetical protein
MKRAPSDLGDGLEMILRIPARCTVPALALLVLATSIAVSAHAVEADHDKRCTLCAVARLSSEAPVPAPVLAVLDVSPDDVPDRPTQRPIVLASLVFSCRAPPLPTE